MIQKIKQFAKISSGNTPLRSKHNEFYLNGIIPWVKTMDLNNGEITNTDERITIKAANTCKPLKKGTVLVAMYGGFNQIGRTGILKIRASINQAISAIEVNRKICIPEYLIQYLNQNIIQWRRFAASSRKDPNITSKDVGDFKVYLPTLTEQQAISDILSTWDEAIETMESLIEAKDKYFKYLMYSLISKSNLSKINTDWRTIKLGEVCKITTGQTSPQDKSIFSSTGIPSIRVSSLDMLLGKSSTQQTEYIGEKTGNELKLKVFDKGTIIFAKSGMSALLPRVYKLTEKSYIVSHLCALIPHEEIIEDYLLYYLRMYHPNRLIQGDGFPSIKTSEVKSFKIVFPSLEKQYQIADKLSVSEKEMNYLKQLTNKYKEQKRGFMQKLLTGEWRVK